MKKTTTPLHLFKKESKQTESAGYNYPASKDLLSALLSYARATTVVPIMSKKTVLYLN